MFQFTYSLSAEPWAKDYALEKSSHRCERSKKAIPFVLRLILFILSLRINSATLPSIDPTESPTSLPTQTCTTCTDCGGASHVVITPGTINIRESAFAYCTSLVSISIPSSVTSIGDNAFRDCTALTNVSIPNNVSSIGYNAFYHCTSLLSVSIPSSVTSIGDNAFSDCTALTKVSIPNSVITIGSGLFSYCTSLVSVSLPNSITSLGLSMFYGCTSLSNVSIPSSVTMIGSSAFRMCASMTTISIPSSVTSIGDSAFSDTSLTSILIPSSVITIGSYAFKGCTLLKNVTIASGYIGVYSFSGCIALRSVYIQSGVSSIGYYAFNGCTSLSSVIISYGVSTLANDVFHDCKSLVSVDFPSSVTSIGAGTFNGCTALMSVTIPSSTSISTFYLFYECTSLVSFTIPSTVTSISGLAFYGCTSLTSVTIPSTVTSIAFTAFQGCILLKSVTIPSSVTSIGSMAFYGCTSLTSVTIPSSVVSIGSSAFYGCTSLVCIYGSLASVSVGTNAFQNCPLTGCPPSSQPSGQPSSLPSMKPSVPPSSQPTSQPSIPSSQPSYQPSNQPSSRPTSQPTVQPSNQPSHQPSSNPSRHPSSQPSYQPISQPSRRPSIQPIVQPSNQPVSQPTKQPSLQPSKQPTVQPSSSPSKQPFSSPTYCPTAQPTGRPTDQPLSQPSSEPSWNPSQQPGSKPSSQPLSRPSSPPTLLPSCQPTEQPIIGPTSAPSNFPSLLPSSQPSNSHWNTLVGNQSISVIGLSACKFKIVLPLSVSRASTGSAFSDIEVRPDRDVVSYVLYGGSLLSSSVSVSTMKAFHNSVGFDNGKRSVAVLDDINGDGHNDLIIGDPFIAKSYVFFGSHLGFEHCTKGFTIIGESESDLTGWSVSGAGDVNNDTFPDMIIGAPNARGVGAFYVIYGIRNLTVDLYLSELTELQGFVVYGTSKGDYLGVSVGNAGDVNGDNCDDIIVGELGTSLYYAGCAYVFYGKRHFQSGYSINQFVATEIFKARGYSFSFVGISVGTAGDFNNDGFDDVLIGSTSSRFGEVVYVVIGSSALSDVILSAMTSNQGIVASSAGSVVSALGDVNDDGFDDVLISSVGNRNNGMMLFIDASLLVAVTDLPTVSPSLISNLPTVKPTRYPTFLPSLRPTRFPSSFCPSLTPTVWDSSISDPSGSPTILFSVSPSVEPSNEPTESPTVNPSFEPSESPSKEPSRKPSCCPSLLPTFGSTFAPSSSRPTSQIIVRSPYSVPTLLPSARAPFPEVVDMHIGGQSSFYNDSLSELSIRYVVNGTGLIEIDPSYGKCVYVIVPNIDLTLTILRFNVSSDQIDLTLFPDIHQYSDLIITAGSVIITLPTREVVHIMNQEPSAMSEKNFIFGAAIKNERNILADSILKVLAIVLPFSFVVAVSVFLYWLYGGAKSKVIVLLTKRRYIGSFDLDDKGEYIEKSEPTEVKSIDLSDHTIDSNGEWQDKVVQSHFADQHELQESENLTVNNFYNGFDGLNRFQFDHSEPFFHTAFNAYDNANNDCDEDWFTSYHARSDQMDGNGYQKYSGNQWTIDVESNYQAFEEYFQEYCNDGSIEQPVEDFDHEQGLFSEG